MQTEVMAARTATTGRPNSTAAKADRVAPTAARPASTGRLVLAGEATSVTHPATAHGAFLSGGCSVQRPTLAQVALVRSEL